MAEKIGDENNRRIMTQIVPAVIVGIACIATILIGAWWIQRTLTRSMHNQASSSEALALLQNQLNAGAQQSVQQLDILRRALSESMETLNAQLSRNLAETNKNVSQRLDTTSRVIGDVRQQLGQLEESSKRMLDVGREITKLEQVLRSPKLRGSLGELFLADLLAQILPPAHYRLQHRFKGGETVDAVVILQSGMVPIDAKFPLENFKRIFSAPSEDEKKAAKKTFVRDVRTHVDAISAKYIRTDEGTFDFALMYVPAENVYYETIVRDEEFGDEMALFNYALKKRVIPVSPNSFYAYLQTIILGLKGMRVEERAHEILQGLSRVQQEFSRFSEAFRLVGLHLDNASKKYVDAQTRFGKVETKMDQITGLAQAIEPTEDAAALPAADEEHGS